MSIVRSIGSLIRSIVTFMRDIVEVIASEITFSRQCGCTWRESLTFTWWGFSEVFIVRTHERPSVARAAIDAWATRHELDDFGYCTALGCYYDVWGYDDGDSDGHEYGFVGRGGWGYDNGYDVDDDYGVIPQTRPWLDPVMAATNTATVVRPVVRGWGNPELSDEDVYAEFTPEELETVRDCGF